MYQIFYTEGLKTIGCEIFRSEKTAEIFAQKNYRNFNWFVEQIQ